MTHNELHETAKALVAPGKGLLAADESDGTIKKRFTPIGVESTEEHRSAYREMLFTTPGAEEYISGVILFDETIRQSASDGTPFCELLASKGIMPGIKVDTEGVGRQAGELRGRPAGLLSPREDELGRALGDVLTTDGARRRRSLTAGVCSRPGGHEPGVQIELEMT